MTTYTAVTAGERDADSPINVGLIGKMIDNPVAITEGSAGAPKIQSAALDAGIVTAAKVAANTLTDATIATNAIGEDELKAGAVHQANMAMTTSDHSVTNIADDSAFLTFVPTGGIYTLGAFSMWTTSTGGPDVNFIEVIARVNNPSGTGALGFRMTADSGIGANLSSYCQENYIQASPPYKIGNLDYPYFCNIVLDKNNKIKSSSIAKDPCWAYNGPHKCSADNYIKVMSEDGKTYKSTPVIDCLEIPPELLKIKHQDPVTFVKEKAKLKVRQIELTPEMKNKNMPHMPFPMTANKKERKILLAPDDRMMNFLMSIHNDPELHFHDLVLNDKIRIKEEVSILDSPPGVHICKAVFK